MARKQTTVSRRMLFTWFILGGLILLLAPQKLTNQLQMAFAHIFHWPLSISRNLMLSARIRQPIKEPVDHSEIQLQNRNANLEAMLAEAMQRNKKLTAFLREYPMPGDEFIFANITKISGNEMIINCGQNQPLKAGQFVLGDNSIIGTVSEVAPYSSKVRLITSPLSRIAVKIGNKDAVIEGDKDKLKIELIPKSFEIKAGEKVFCKPKQGFLYTPITIGNVVECKTSTKNLLLWQIIVEPACDIETLTSVDVIIINTDKQGK